MAEKEIILQGEDGQVDELVLTTQDQASCNSLEDCVRMLFPQEGETAPRLRFKGFDGKWEKRLLSDCLEISEEKNTDNVFGVEDVLSVSDDYGVVNQIEHLGRSYAGKSVSGYKILRPGQIVYTKSPLRAKPYGIVKVNRGKAGIVSVLYAVYNTKEGVAPEYIHYYFDPAWRLNAYMRPLVNKGAKNTMNISDETALTGYIMIPKDIDEQRKIASFLQRLDEQVKHYQEQFDRLKQLKTACFENMFPKKDKAAPSLRFNGFEGEWKVVEFGSILKESLERSMVENEDVLLSSSIEGMFLNSELFTHQRGRSNIGYRKLKKNMLVLSAQNLHLGNANVNLRFEHGLVSPAYKIYDILNCSPNFLYHWIKREEAKKFFLDATTAGASLCRKNIVWQDLYKQLLLLPATIDEQERIGSFFHKLDAQIVSKQKQIEHLKQLKQSCLGLLFADNQSITPPLRFKGFNGEWRMVMLKDICEINPHTTLPDVFEYVDLESVVGTTMVSHRTERKGSAPSRAQRLAKYGDIFFQTVRPYQRNNYLFKNEEKPYVFSTGYAQIRTIIDEGFLFNAIQTDFFVCQVMDNCTGSSYPAINPTTLSNMRVAITDDIKEQRRIASFFSSLDKQIEIQTQQVEKLKQVKKACLNQFIA